MRIVGHASPRWKGAKNPDEADRRNLDLSRRRSEAVKSAVEKLLRERMGDDVDIRFDVSNPDEKEFEGIRVGATERGSRETLEQAGGDRQRDDEYYRRVEVSVEILTTRYGETGRTYRPQERFSDPWFWDVTVKELGVYGLGIPGPAYGRVELVIKNRDSGKSMTYTAILWGGGDPMPGDTPDKDVGEKERVFVTDEPMLFDDFHNRAVSILRVDYQYGLGVARFWLEFRGLGEEAHVYVGQQFGVGFPGAYLVSGILQKKGVSPTDTTEPEPWEEVVPTIAERTSEEGLILTFPTEQDVLPDTEADRLDMFMTATARRMGGLVPRKP